MSATTTDPGGAAASVEGASAPETFARYLARWYTAKGFVPGTVQEAQAMVGACDLVLTRADPMQFQIVCIVDREAGIDRQFAMPPQELARIGRDCFKYGATISGRKVPVTITVIEAGVFGDFEAARTRLQPYRRSSIFDKVVLSAWILDVQSKQAWCNLRIAGWLLAPRFRRLLNEPRIAPAELRPPAAVVLAPRSTPWLSWLLLLVLIAVFVCEMRYGIEPPENSGTPTVRSLAAFGGLDHAAVLRQGQWYRLLCSIFLHGSLPHLMFNGFALMLVGYSLESMIGRAWYGAAFILGGVGGSLASLALNTGNMICIGASGAIMGLFATAFVCSFRIPPGGERSRMQVAQLRVLVPSLLPLAVGGFKVDYAAHLGGTVTGALLGTLLLALWPADRPHPRLSALAVAVALLGFTASAAAFVPAYLNQGTYRLALRLMPQSELPKTEAEAESKSELLLEQYPHDPRAHTIRAGVLANSHQLAGAEAELRAALRELDTMSGFFKPDYRSRLQLDLDRIVAAEHAANETPVPPVAK